MKARPNSFLCLVVLCALSVFSALARAENPSDLPLARFNDPLERLEATFSADKTPDQILEDIPKQDARGNSFALEGLLRLYLKKYPELAPLLAKSKKLEDELGFYNDSRENLDFGKAVHVPEMIMQQLEKEHADARKRMIDVLEQEGWIRPKEQKTQPVAGRQFREALGRVKWMPPEEDAHYLLGRITHKVKSIQKSDYDMADVNGGLHPLRRAVRWFLIYLQTVRGMVALEDGGANKTHGDLLNSEIANGQYSRLATAEPAVTSMPRRLFLFFNQVVQELGHLKDMGVARESWLKDAILKSGYVKVLRQQGYDKTMRQKQRYEHMAEFSDEDFAEAYARELTKRHPDFKPVTSTAKGIYSEVLAKHILTPIRKRFEKTRKELAKKCPLGNLATDLKGPSSTI